MKSADKFSTPKEMTKFVQVLIPTKVSSKRAAKEMSKQTFWPNSWRVGSRSERANFDIQQQPHCLHVCRIQPMKADFKKLFAAGVRGKLCMITLWQLWRSKQPTSRQLAAAFDLN